MSLLASSFVEEEHQTWYFLTVTIWLASAAHLMVHRLQQINGCNSQSPGQNVSKNQLSAGLIFVTMSCLYFDVLPLMCC